MPFASHSIRVCLLGGLLAASTGCAGEPDPAVGARLVALEPLMALDVEALRAALDEAGFGLLAPIDEGITLARVEYETRGVDGEVALASGLLALPAESAPRGVVSYQHGTISARDEAPSMLTNSEGLLVAAVFAGRGYAYLAPDYLGLGTGTGTHPYIHARTEAAATRDLLTVALETPAGAIDGWDAPIPDGLPVFLLGFSQGAHASLAALRAAETEPGATLVPDAVAAISGPYDLAGVQLPHSLGPDATGGVFYLAYLLDAYRQIYGGPAPAEVFAAPFDGEVPRLYDGEHDAAEISSVLPASTDALLVPGAASAAWFRDALADNEILTWTPRTPVQLYVAAGDTDVPGSNAQAARAYWAARGADVPVIQLGEVDHSTSAALGIVAARQWFDTLIE